MSGTDSGLAVLDSARGRVKRQAGGVAASRWIVSLLGLMLGGCRPAPALSPDDAARLDAPVQDGLVYRGDVYAPGDPAQPRLTYERRVWHHGDDVVSSHLTRRMSGEPMLLHRATHSDAYEVSSFEVVSSQTGMTGAMRVDDSQVSFAVTKNGRTRTRTEPRTQPVVVGPTLFGTTVRHWDALVAGETIGVRFAVVERLRTYPFTLRLLDANTETTRFELRADQRIVRASVPPMVITFDTHTRRVVRYEGRVPPKDEHRGGRDFDARVEYTFFVDRYR